MRSAIFKVSVCAAVVLAAATPLIAQTQRVEPAPFGQPFPTGKYTNLTDGKALVDLAQHLGKRPVVFVYLIPGHERSEAMLKEAASILDGSDVALLGLTSPRDGVTPAQLTQRIQSVGITAPVLYDVGFTVGQQLRVHAVPNMAILDGQGLLRVTNGQSLKQAVEYGLDLAKLLGRLGSSGKLGSYGHLPRYYPVTELIGQSCPDFKAPRLADGVVQRWSSLLAKDKLNVLLFWSIDCPHCRKSLPEIAQWFRSNGSGVNLVSAARIDDTDQKTRTAEFCKINGIDFPTLVDRKRAVADLFLITATPTALIVGPDGVIHDVYLSGASDFARVIEAKRRELLGG